MKKLVLLILLLPFTMVSQNSIQGTFTPAESFNFALLYHVTPTSTNFVKQVKTKTDGTWSISLDADAEKGIYKIVYAVPVEANNFNVFYNGKEDILLVFDLDTGLSFTASEENKIWETYTDSISKLNSLISNYYSKGKTDKSEIKAVFETLRAAQNNFEKMTSGKLIAPFVKSNRTYIPEAYEDIKTYSLNLKKHFFDYMEFGNPLLQNSDFINDRIIAYVFVMPAETHYYKQAIDEVIKATANHDKTQLSILQKLWESMITNKLPEVAIYISDTYLLPLAKTYNNTYLVKIIENYNKTAIGKKAINFDFTYLKNDKIVKTSLYNFNTNKQTVLIFWSSTCSHCLKELPKVKTIMDRHPEVTVLAYGLESDISSWEEATKNYKGFTQTYDLRGWNSQAVKEYGISVTPTFFVLDADKTIIAKPGEAEDLYEIFKK
ncbi:TlpA family protein disulfide reductase [Bizionia argentinensis]|nr:thioredoxin-like domain-containing protein [Bizionia argentinensis]